MNRSGVAAYILQRSRRTTPFPRRDLGCDVQRPKTVPRMKEVVTFAQQAEVPRVGCAEPSVGFDVVELQKGRRTATGTYRPWVRVGTALASGVVASAPARGPETPPGGAPGSVDRAGAVGA